MDKFHSTFNIFGKYSDLEAWQKAEWSSPVKKRKREESSEEGEAKWHKVLDDTDVDKIEEDHHELNTKKCTVWAMSVLKDWLEDLNFSGQLISCVLKNVLFNVFRFILSGLRSPIMTAVLHIIPYI